MKIIEKLRGDVEKQNIKHLNKKFHKMLGRNVKRHEINFLPRLMYCLTEQSVDIEMLNGYELDLLQEYQDKGLLVKHGADIGCVKEFWDFINEIVYDRYVCEVEE